MFKRANKVTALLVAAASVMSMVPAFAADVKKIDSEDGTVYGAVAYKDGTALIDGEVNDNDAAYYFADGKYTELGDVDSGSDYAAYGSKYAKVDDGSDYNVDLSDGKVIDDDQPSNDEDDAASALRKKIKDSDRYTDTTVGSVYGDTDIADLTILKGNKFADDIWYSTVYGVVSGEFATGNTATSVNVYTDGKGSYIDADYNLGKIKVEATGTSVNIENTKDLYEVVSGSKTAYVSISNANVLGQDKDNIYRYVTLTVNVPGATGSIKINNKSFTVSSNKVDLDVIQKISKAQDSDDVDDGKYAKTVTNYVISDDDATVGSDAAKYLALAKDSAVEGKVINGKLALYKVTDTSSADNVAVQAATLKNKNGYYYTDVESQTTIQAEYSTDLNKVAVDTDVDGNVYVLDGGYVKEFDGTDDWNKVYKVDGSFDSLSVYDKDSMVVWSQDDEVYSVIGGKKAADEDTTTPTTPVTTAGWTQTSAGWTYTKADGTKATGWLQDGGAWYYLKADGVMATGWVQDGATWYYLNGSGAMQTGWLNDNGTWYYLNGSGAMLANTTTPDGYYVGANGAWVR
ncbi:MAG: N-acetylmuramoyl-L-alanine amidase family protein [Clostridium beijerinckii]